MPNTEKVSAVAEITEHFNASTAAVITEYRGLTVKQLTQLLDQQKLDSIAAPDP